MSGLVWFAAGAAVAGAILWIRLWREKRRIAGRARQLTEYLELVNCGRESALPRCEDELSLLEDELYKTVGELRLAKEQAQKERLRQADNLADIAHQLKTPITSMSLMAQLLHDGAGERQADCLRRLEGQLCRLERLTSSLLLLSRLDAGAITFEPADFRFEELAARAGEPVEEAVRSRGQTLQVHGGMQMVRCDPAWTAEALLNLVKNCSEHLPTGGRIDLSCTETPLYLEILVEDDGPGFDPQELPKLFRRFYRGKRALAGGIGIGLALARSILEEQGGMIRAENRAEGGARFVVRFYAK